MSLGNKKMFGYQLKYLASKMYLGTKKMFEYQ